MNYLEVHWKGRPHRHVPPIRFASRRTSFRSRSLIQVAAEQAVRKPFTFQSENKRKLNFIIRFRRRRTGTSRSTSSAAWARRRASLQARQVIQIYGWDSTAAEVASIATRFKADHPSSIRLKTHPGTSIARQLVPGTTGSTTRPLMDGASGSTLKNFRALRTKNIKTRRGSQSPNSVELKEKALCLANRQHLTTTRSTVPVGPRTTIPQKSTHGCWKCNKRGSPCGSKIDRSRHSAVSTEREDKRNSIISRRISKQGQKGESIRTPNLRELQVSATRQSNDREDLGTDTLSSDVKSLLSDKPSRTLSQRRALKQFTKELRLYLHEAFPKPESESSSPSATTVSVDTFAALRPYQSEFQSAGLAVTSDEQRGMAFKKSSRRRKLSIPSLTNVEASGGDEEYCHGNLTRNCNIDKQESRLLTKNTAQQSQMSGSTGTTVIGFTPPHEKTYGPFKTPVSQRRSSPDHTVIGFAPPHETVVPTPSPVSRPSTKKSLPWLRKQGLQSEDSPRRKSSNRNAVLKDEIATRDMVRPLIPQEPLPLDEIIGFSRKGTGVTYKTPGPLRASHFSDIRSKIIEAKKWQTTSREFCEEPELTVQTTKTPIAIKSRYMPNQYADIGTQTYPSYDVEAIASDVNQNFVASRAPLPTGLNRTIPSATLKRLGICGGDSKQTLPSGPIATTPRLSKVRVDEAIQTDEVEIEPLGEPQVEESVPSTLRQRQLVGHDQTSASAHKSAKVPCTPLPSTLTRSPQGGLSTWNSDVQIQRINNSIKSPPVPSCQRLAVPRCTQCNCDIEHITSLSNRKPPFESEYELRLVAREYPSHRCRARSSIQCQQCFSSSRASTAISPLGSPFPTFQNKSEALEVNNFSARKEIALEYLPIVKAVRGEDIKHGLLDSCLETFVPEPVKRPTLPTLKTICSPLLRPQPRVKSTLDTTYMCAKALPQIPQPPANPSNPLPLGGQTPIAASADTFQRPRGDSSQVLALRGLRVATAAACDEDVNKQVEEITGLAVREFLADLGRFEGLSHDTLMCAARRIDEQDKKLAERPGTRQVLPGEGR